MAASCSWRATRLTPDSIPAFLAPALFRASPNAAQRSLFSTTVARASKGRDRNKQRGVSALRRTGPKHRLSVSNEPLPRPVLDPAKRSKPTVKEDHGLWEFFNADRKAMVTPEGMAAHGRSWTINELRYKSFEDLHSLWWVCLKEMNRINTLDNERERMRAGYGHREAADRADTVRGTQRAIKWVLTERWYAWEDAKRIERNNPERAAELMGVPLDSFVDSDVTDESLPSEKGLDPSDFELPDTNRPPSAPAR